MDMSAVVRFLDRERDQSDDAAAVRDRLSGVINGLGFDFFKLVRQAGPESEAVDLVLAEQWPNDWPELYVKRKYATIDPTIRYLGHSQGGFRWREPMECLPERSPLQAHGADDGRCPSVRT
jgi:LuxR family transcriptional regulator